MRHRQTLIELSHLISGIKLDFIAATFEYIITQFSVTNLVFGVLIIMSAIII